MASPQPLVCTSLHLPPDLRPFLRIYEICLHIFLPNLDRLRLALEADQDINPEATKIFAETRKVSRQELQNVAKALYIAQVVAERYSKVLEALSEGKPTHDSLLNFHLGASGAVNYSEEAQEAMNVFRRELESAVRRVTSTLAHTSYKTGSKNLLTSPENAKSVSEILSAIDECDVLLQQCHDQFASLATQTRDKNSVDSNPPSEEETQVMRTKWQTYYDNIRSVWLHTFRITTQIEFPTSYNLQRASETHKSRQKVPLWRTLFRRQNKRNLVRSTNALRPCTDPETIFITAPSSSPELQTNVINPLILTEGRVASGITEITDATPSNNPPALQIPFWRRIFRRNNSTLDDEYHR